MSRTRPAAGQALTTTQAAAFLGVSERTLRRYLTLGLLSYGRLPGGHYRLREETLQEFLGANLRQTKSSSATSTSTPPNATHRSPHTSYAAPSSGCGSPPLVEDQGFDFPMPDAFERFDHVMADLECFPRAA